MDYHTLAALRCNHPAWRLLAAGNAPMIAGFLYRTFIQPNVRTMSQQELTARLEDYIYLLRERLGEGGFPKPAANYLDDWAGNESGWLRKYYPPDSDEPHFDMTPATEKAIDWLAGLGQRPFVGTASRLITVFELLRQIATGTQADPKARIAELEKRKAQIDEEISRVRDGRLDLLDATEVKDRFQQMAATARSLLSDFREVEQNFRNLDRTVRERIAIWEGGKGTLLDNIFGERDAIADSDQGKSFRAFWDLLMSPSRQEELADLLETTFALAPVQELAPDRRLLRIHYDWLEAGEAAQRTVARLSERLRRYLDDQAWLENRRIMQIIHRVEQSALAVRNRQPERPLMSLDEPAPSVDLAMDRLLFSPPIKPRITERALLHGDEDVAIDALIEQVYVDKAELASRIRRALQTHPQVSLAGLLEVHPLEQGLAELVSYLELAAGDCKALIDDCHTQTVEWIGRDGNRRRATLPLVIFNR